MSRLATTVVCLLAVVYFANAQFIGLPAGLQGLVPQPLVDAFGNLTKEQFELLVKVNKGHTLGAPSIVAVQRVRDRVAKLPASIGSNKLDAYYNLLPKISQGGKSGNAVLKKLISGFEALTVHDRNIISDQFPEVVRTLENEVVRKLAGLPPVI